MKEIATNKYLGFKFSVFKEIELIDQVKYNIENNHKCVYYGYSLTQIPWMKEKKELFDLSDKFDVYVPDGKGFHTFLKILGFSVGDHVSLPDLTDIVIQLADKYKFSVFLLGASKESNSEAVKNLRKQYPNAVIYDGIDGYFKESDEPDIVGKINEVKPDILLLGMSSPKKELFVCNYKDQLHTKIIVHCGGMFDIYANLTKREPLWMKKLSLAWIYRFLQEPVRMLPILKYGLIIIFYIAPISFLYTRIFRKKDFSIVDFYIRK